MKLFSSSSSERRLLLVCTSLIVSLSMGLCSCSAPHKHIKKSPLPDVTNHSELTETESFPVKLTISEQESFIIQEKPSRLAVLSADLAQALEDIGAAGTISNICSDAPSSINAPGAKISGTVLGPDLDTIIASKPDWVLTSAPMRQTSLETLSHHGIQVITFPVPSNPGEICDRYQMLFTLCFGSKGNPAYQEFIEKYQKKFDSIVNPIREYTDITRKKSAIYLAVPDYTMATAETFESQLLENLSLNNLGNLGSQWLYPENEQNALDPEIIFYDRLLSPEQIIQSDVYKNCAAVREGQLYPVDFSAVRLRGVPMMEELEKMARAAYPEAFPH